MNDYWIPQKPMDVITYPNQSSEITPGSSPQYNGMMRALDSIGTCNVSHKHLTTLIDSIINLAIGWISRVNIINMMMRLKKMIYTFRVCMNAKRKIKLTVCSILHFVCSEPNDTLGMWEYPERNWYRVANIAWPVWRICVIELRGPQILACHL